MKASQSTAVRSVVVGLLIGPMIFSAAGVPGILYSEAYLIIVSGLIHKISRKTLYVCCSIRMAVLFILNPEILLILSFTDAFSLLALSALDAEPDPLLLAFLTSHPWTVPLFLLLLFALAALELSAVAVVLTGGLTYLCILTYRKLLERMKLFYFLKEGNGHV